MNQIEMRVMEMSMQCSLEFFVIYANSPVIRREVVRRMKNGGRRIHPLMFTISNVGITQEVARTDRATEEEVTESEEGEELRNWRKQWGT